MANVISVNIDENKLINFESFHIIHKYITYSMQNKKVYFYK